MEAKILRPLGKLECAAAARHYLGHYRSVCHAARYQTIDGLTLEDWKSVLVQVLSTFVTRHGALCIGLVGEETEQPHFVRLPQLDLREIVTAVTLRSLTDESVVEHLSQQHELMWPSLAERPGWKVNVLGTSGQNFEVEVILVFHHAFFDGISGLNVHSMIQHELEARSSDASQAGCLAHLVPIPPSCHPLPPVEALTPLPMSWACFLRSWRFILKQYWGLDVPDLSLWRRAGSKAQKDSIWTGNSPALPSLDAYRCHVRLVTLGLAETEQLKAVCKQQGCSVTGLLHGVIVDALARLQPSASGFSGHTPYSMRPWTGTDVATALCNETSDYCCLYSRHDIQEPFLCSKTDPTEDVLQSPSGIWAVARKFRTGLKSHLQSVPQDNALAEIRYISSWHAFLKEQMGKPRPLSFEVSNVGTYDNTTTQAIASGFSLVRYIQSQSGYVSGPPLSVSLASLRSGPMTVTMSWQEGAADPEIPDAVMESIELWLNYIAASSNK